MTISSEPLQHVTDFIDTVLHWTPDILLAEDAYDGDVHGSPHLPQTQDVDEYKSAYRPAVRAEIYAQLSEALQRPDKLVRPIHATQMTDLFENHNKETLGSRSVMLHINFHTSPDLRPKDFVFISPSKQPWQETAVFCAPGLTHWEVDPKPLECHTAFVEVSKDVVETLRRFIAPPRKLYVIAISSIASGYRILDALCDSRHSELLMDHILRPVPVSDPALSHIRPDDAAIVEMLSLQNKPLNQAQKLTIISALQPLHKPVPHPILLLGPPGTGKTHTLSSLILAITLAKPDQAIHVVAPSNAAVREIAVRLLRDSKRTSILHTSQMCLFGNKESVDTADGIDAIYFESRSCRLKNFEIRLAQAKADLADFHGFARRDDQDQPSVPMTWEWRKAVVNESCALLAALISDLTDLFVNCRPQAEKCLAMLTKWADGSRVGIDSLDDPQKDLILSALPLLQQCGLTSKLDLGPGASNMIERSTKIAFSTVSSAGSKPLQAFLRRNPLIILDEATQSVEPEMSLLLRPGIKGLIAIGDPKQLPSVVSNRHLRAKGFSVSLFERLYKAGSPHIMLEIQYRMAPAISMWPSSIFYGKRLVDASLVRDLGRIPTWQDAKAVNTAPYNFINIPGSEEFVESTTSYRNVLEADVIVGYLKTVCQHFVKTGHSGAVEIGCIAGYTEQVDLLRRKISSLLPGIKHWQTTSRINRMQLRATATCIVTIDIASVDAFQGQERDIILFATTRANFRRNIGFLSDPRRLNVALTRARHMLKIFGNSDTLTSSSSWESLIQDAVSRGCYEDASNTKNSWQVTTKQISTAHMDDAVAQIRSNGSGPKMKLADGMASLAQVELKAESIWKVVFTKTCKQQIQMLNSGSINHLIKSFEVFANGYPARAARSGFPVPGIQHFVKCLPIRGRKLLWSVRVLATPRSPSTPNTQYEYGQVIWLWAYPLDSALQATVRCIESACANFTEQYLELCAAEEWSDGRVIPTRFSQNTPIIERRQTPRGPATASSTDTTELDLARAYEINPRVCRALTEGFLAKVELPFVLSAEETALVHDMDSTFVIGRSGTGKTTAMVLRMFAKAESAEDARCPQMLLTASPKLCLAIRAHFKKLRQNWSNGITEHGRLLTATHDEEDILLNVDDPPTLQALKDSDFPLFWTFGYLLRVLDRSVPGARFWGFRRATSDLRYPSEVDWERFQTHYLHRMPSQARKAFVGGSKLFAEIQTIIKGSLEVLETGQPLTLEQYLQGWDGRNNNLSMVELRLAYDCFEVYQKLLQQENEWDLNDAVQNPYSRCTSYPEICESFVLETLAVDEVQDMNAVSLALLKFLLNGPGACDVIHYAGDAAQVINSAANFRFADLKKLYFDVYLPHLAKTDPHIARMLRSKSDAGRLVPRLKPMTMNYRSVESIVMLGNAILAWMTDYFPGSIDRLTPDHGLAQGGLPVFLELMSIEDFLARVVGAADSVDIGNIEFGADQAIIVRNAAAKQEVKKLVGACAIVLDIKECKGLEFDDVILYNFFSDSTFQRWRVVDTDADTKVEFDPLRDQLLLFELKQLYVAVTRARTNLWIYDQSERGTAVRNTLQGRQLVTTLKKATYGELLMSLAKRSTPEEWNQAGLRFFRENNYEEALPCFVRSGNITKEREVRAYVHMKEADQLEGSRTSSGMRKAAREREQAGDLFQILDRHRLAATQYQIAGEAISSATVLVKAADAWIQSGKTEAIGQSVLRCLVLAGSSAYTKLLLALEMGWIARNDAYWRTLNTLAERYGEEASDADIARIARLLRTLEERIQFLEDLGKKVAVEDLLRSSGEWERLGLSYEKRGELAKAEEAWRAARRTDVLERIRVAGANLSIWIRRQQNGEGAQDDNTSIGVLLGTERSSSTIYYELLENLRQTRQSQATMTESSDFGVEQVESLVKLIETVHAKYPKYQEFCTHLCSGGFPDLSLAEDLGLYRTQHREPVYLVANKQIATWETFDYPLMADASLGHTPATSSQIAKILGGYCKAAAKALEQSVLSLNHRLWLWSTRSNEDVTQFQLKIRAAFAYGNHISKLSVPDISTLDDFILGLDRLLYPISSRPQSDTASLIWLKSAKEQSFLEQIVHYRRDLREEADTNVVITALKWTGPSGPVLSLPPSNVLLNNLIEATGWGVLAPSSGIQPLAESVLRLDGFFAAWESQIVPLDGPLSVPDHVNSDMLICKRSATARSQLYVLDRIFFAIICLIDRFHETVLPTRLLTSELTQGAQRAAAVALLQRNPDSLGYADDTAYWREPKFKRIHQNLRRYLLNLLVKEQRLQDILGTFEATERPFYVKRIITLAICLYCSRNFNPESHAGVTARNDLVQLHESLQQLGRNLACAEVRSILARTLSIDKRIGSRIQDLTRLAAALGDPIRAVIDALKWKGNALGIKMRVDIPKTYIRVLNGELQMSGTSDFGTLAGPVSKVGAPSTIDDDNQEDAEATEHEGGEFKATGRTLAEMEAEMEAALHNPVIRRYLVRWIRQHRYEQSATRNLMATDKIGVLRILKRNPVSDVREVLLDEVCLALSQVNDSSLEKGSELLLCHNQNSNSKVLKTVLGSRGKGSPIGWIKSLRQAAEGLTDAFEALRARLDQSDQIGEELIQITEQSRQLIITANEFDKEHKAVIDAYFKKKAAKAQ